MISIIIPVFNSKDTIERCIDSIIYHNKSEYEIILVDDGSTDGSGELCEKIAKRDSKVKIFHQKNKGASVARNLGLSYAQGDLITFIDSDDYVQPNYFPEFISEEADLYVQNRIILNNSIYDGLEEELQSQFVYRDCMDSFCKQYLHFEVFRSPCCKFYKNEIIKTNNISFHPEFRLGEDTLFNLEYMKYVKNIYVLNTSKYVYVKPQGCWEAKYYNIHIKEALKYLDAFWKAYKEMSYKNVELLKIVYELYQRVIFHGQGNKGVYLIKRLIWSKTGAIMQIEKEIRGNEMT